MKKSGILSAGLSSMLVLALTACGTFKTREKIEAEVSQIKSVAVVAFEFERPVSSQISLDVGKGLKASEGGGGLGEENAELIQVYKQLGQALEKKLHWKVKNREEILAHASYRSLFKNTMTGWQNKMPVSSGMKRFTLPETMDMDATRIMGPEGRKKLMEDLGVDALVVAKLHVGLNGTTVAGIGNRYPQTSFFFQVYNKNQENPVWFDSIKGDESKESVGKTAFIDENLVDDLGKKSALSAFEKIQ